tara:strand:+ start:2985 stop:3314 length:330 start_codon:yes stop_codon:yes gene_type:complete
MTDLLNKLDALVAQNEKNKLEQADLIKEIELNIEKKRRLEMEGTVTKLRTQVDELLITIDGKFMLNRQRKKVDRLLITLDHHDIIPIFRTMIGIMSKQQHEIDQLKTMN